MYMKYSQGGKTQYDATRWLVDTEDEISTIPMSRMGSTIYVIATGENWMMDSKGNWYPVTDPSKDPVECDCVEESTIWAEIPTI